ncbi:MAG TPA: UDP-N-acetylmuramate dehydrogenase [Phycisphaerales bacterium]|nr:UDP-N-acetylmuramate dehydrogenase [Phycisphaerales bacterium]
MPATLEVPIQHGVPIKTWFEIGGPARRFAVARSADELRSLLAVDPALRILGDGANLLVHDDGVDDLVVSLAASSLSDFRIDAKTGLVTAGAGTHLFKLINETVAAGLGGLEVLAGVPATIGGAVVMNAGGAYGEIAHSVRRVFALTREGQDVVLERREIDFSYRHSGLNHLLITGVELQLTPGDPTALAARKKEINDAKKASQPLNANSAGCCFKNPTLREAIPGIGDAGKRVSAGLLIDRAGLKGLRVGGAEVSDRHGNFIVVDKEHAKARDVIELMEKVASGVQREFGVPIEREVVVWRRER